MKAELLRAFGPKLLRRRGTGSILVGAFASSFGAYLLVPYLTVLLTSRGQLTVSQATLTVGLMYWLLRGASLFGPLLVQKFQLRHVLVGACALRALGYLPLLTGNTAFILVGLALVSVGGGLYFPVSKVYLNSIVASDQQLEAIATRNTFANAGAGLGPAVGLALFAASEGAFVAGTSICFVMLSALLMRLPDAPSSATSDAVAGRFEDRGITAAELMPAVLLSVLIGSLLVQPEAIFSILASKVGVLALIPVFFTVNAILVAALQPVGLWLFNILGALSRVAIGVAAVYLAFVCIALPAPLIISVLLWSGAAALFAIGEILLSLLLDDYIRTFARHTQSVMYGVGGVSDAFAGAAAAGLTGVAVGLDGLPTLTIFLPIIVTTALAALIAGKLLAIRRRGYCG